MPSGAARLRSVPRATGSGVPQYFVLDDEPVALVPPRDFQATITRYEIRYKFERPNLYLWCKLVALDDPSDAQYHGLLLPFICPMKNGRFGSRSKFARLWTRVAGRRARKGEKLSPTLFLGKLYTVRTRLVTMDYQQRPHDRLTQYSVIDEIVSVDVGGPA